MMSDPFVGEIRMFGGNYPPKGWAFCNGDVLSSSQYKNLNSLIGSIYGGDGKTTFGLPDMRGRIPLNQGDGAGLSSRPIGSMGGSEAETLSIAELPAHQHSFQADTQTAQGLSPEDSLPAMGVSIEFYDSDSSGPVAMAPDMVGETGGSQAHSNLMPALCVNFIIALAGLQPVQS